ncbi:MAG: hypothetical protein RLZZ515_1878 [Cyanobacteriota bacterium]
MRLPVRSSLRNQLWALLVSGLLVLVALIAPPAALATGAQNFPEQLPAAAVLDEADLLSRAANAEVTARLESLSDERVDARLITLRRLDYGTSLETLGQNLLERWQNEANADRLLLLLIESQNNSAAVVAGSGLQQELSAYRQASLDALARLEVVLNGQDDPGPPQLLERMPVETNIPTKEETASSNALLWVVFLLVVGTLVPMITWWVFSR